jgi:hypothetical protein
MNRRYVAHFVNLQRASVFVTADTVTGALVKLYDRPEFVGDRFGTIDGIETDRLVVRVRTEAGEVDLLIIELD